MKVLDEKTLNQVPFYRKINRSFVKLHALLVAGELLLLCSSGTRRLGTENCRQNSEVGNYQDAQKMVGFALRVGFVHVSRNKEFL